MGTAHSKSRDSWEPLNQIHHFHNCTRSPSFRVMHQKPGANFCKKGAHIVGNSRVNPRVFYSHFVVAFRSQGCIDAFENEIVVVALAGPMFVERAGLRNERVSVILYLTDILSRDVGWGSSRSLDMNGGGGSGNRGSFESCSRSLLLLRNRGPM